MTVQEIEQTAYDQQWFAWRRQHEKNLADPHGFLAITDLHWLDAEPRRFADAPGAWSTGPDGVTVVLADDEELIVDGAPVRGTYRFAAIPERGSVHAAFGDAVVEVAKRGRQPGSLFILFTDATSGVTTYAANRTLSVDAPAADGTVVLDFNRAVNLVCAYTDFATCPLPPAENRLPIAVEAGEKIPYERLVGPAA
jgi:uncharacterized protein (DUF1684 family)